MIEIIGVTLSKEILVAMLIESALISATLLLLVQPGPFFVGRSKRVRESLQNGGYVLLTLTFVWSVVLGCVLALSRISPWI